MAPHCALFLKCNSLFRLTANLPYGPPMITDDDYYQTFYILSNVVLVVPYLLEEEKPLLAL